MHFMHVFISLDMSICDFRKLSLRKTNFRILVFFNFLSEKEN